MDRPLTYFFLKRDLLQAFALNDRRPRLTTTTIVSRRTTITAKVSHQNWCKVSQQKPWSYVVRQSPQKCHTRTGAKFHSKSHGRMWSDNHRKSFTPELVQSFTAKAMVVCGQTITAKVSHQNWCKVSQQKPWSCVVRQSPQKFHTRTGAKSHSKSHGRVWSDNHRKSFTPELVQSFSKVETKSAHFNRLQSTNFLYSLSLVGM